MQDLNPFEKQFLLEGIRLAETLMKKEMQDFQKAGGILNIPISLIEDTATELRKKLGLK